MRSAVGDGAAACFLPAGQVDHGSHAGRTWDVDAWKRPAVQGLHARLEAFEGATVCRWPAPHVTHGVQAVVALALVRVWAVVAPALVGPLQGVKPREMRKPYALASLVLPLVQAVMEPPLIGL